MNSKLEIKFSSVMENVCRAEEFICNVFSDFKIHDILHGRITTVVIEAVNNAILFGNESNPSKFVNLQFKHYNGYYEFVVSDEGAGFDFSVIPDPTLPENLEKESGRGLFLMNELSDELHFEQDGSRVVMRFFNNIKNLL